MWSGCCVFVLPLRDKFTQSLNWFEWNDSLKCERTMCRGEWHEVAWAIILDEFHSLSLSWLWWVRRCMCLCACRLNLFATNFYTILFGTAICWFLFICIINFVFVVSHTLLIYTRMHTSSYLFLRWPFELSPYSIISIEFHSFSTQTRALFSSLFPIYSTEFLIFKFFYSHFTKKISDNFTFSKVIYGILIIIVTFRLFLK